MMLMLLLNLGLAGSYRFIHASLEMTPLHRVVGFSPHSFFQGPKLQRDVFVIQCSKEIQVSKWERSGMWGRNVGKLCRILLCNTTVSYHRARSSSQERVGGTEGSRPWHGSVATAWLKDFENVGRGP